jgi:2-polyprenyl-3-methyl-5-hydroxy-6-metoxy-1,4-benzoquinol methylase
MSTTATVEVTTAEQGPARAANFARQALETCRPWLPAPPAELKVLDVGCNRGFTTTALAGLCKEVVGIEPSDLVEHAVARQAEERLPNVTFRRQFAEELTEREEYDFVLLDNVFEHMAHQAAALEKICQAMKPGAVLYIVVVNKLWPIEIHYKLPFLSYLPLRLANAYLRATGRGTDFTDCSYAPTYFGLKRYLRARKELTWQFVVPARLNWTATGAAWHYRLGVKLLTKFPLLWVISKGFLVVAKKQ